MISVTWSMSSATSRHLYQFHQILLFCAVFNSFARDIRNMDPIFSNLANLDVAVHAVCPLWNRLGGFKPYISFLNLPSFELFPHHLNRLFMLKNLFIVASGLALLDWFFCICIYSIVLFHSLFTPRFQTKILGEFLPPPHPKRGILRRVPHLK